MSRDEGASMSQGRAPLHRARVNRGRRTVLYGVVGAVVSVCLVLVLWSILPGADARWATLRLDILRIQVINGPLVPVVYGLAGLGLVSLLVRRWRVKPLTATLVTVAVAVSLTALSLWYINECNLFGVGLDQGTTVWALVTFAGVGVAVGALWWSGWRRRTVAVASICVFLAAGTLGINADFGLDSTIADLAGVSLAPPLRLPSTSQMKKPSELSSPQTGPLWQTWTPPADMPRVGTTGQIVIPPTVSGFHSRPAGIYLPPAALVANPPRLPLVIMMMGQPGNPDPSYVASVLNDFAAQNRGLAPIVLVVDQLGNPAIDTLCLNTSRYGNVETFLSVDVVNWARTHLHVLQDPAHWIVAGYSNGGECALSLGATYPQIWDNVLDISGEAYPGSDASAATLRTAFNGDRPAYHATFPSTILAAGHYPNTVGIFTVGSNDTFYVAQARDVRADAAAAGWKTTYWEVPNGGHVLKALMGGLSEGFSVLYPRLGLSEPVDDTSSQVSVARSPLATIVHSMFRH